MTAKEYISQIVGINARIKAEEIELKRLISDKWAQSEIDQQRNKIKRLRILKAEVEKTVSSITDGRNATLLLLRYEHCCKWGYIATVLSTDKAPVSEDLARGRMHERALKDLEKKLKLVTK